MTFIQCPGCQEVLDVRGLGSVVCPACNRCLVCGEKGDARGKPACRHRLDDEIAGLEASLKCPDELVDCRTRLAAIKNRGYSAKAWLAIIGACVVIGAPAEAFALVGTDRFVDKTVGAIVYAIVSTVVYMIGAFVIIRGLPHLLARGWFPWMVKDK